MSTDLSSAVIQAVGVVLAAVSGALIGRLPGWDRLFARNPFPRLAGTRWESTWIEKIDGDEKNFSEIFEFTKQKHRRIYGIITMQEYPDMIWNIEGDYNDRFLRLFWHPSRDAPNKFFLDYGCYFFERKGTGSFKGYAVGYDSRTNKIEIDEHSLRQLR